MNIIDGLENFLNYLRLHKGRSMKTLEQYEFHIWRLLCYLEPLLLETENKKTINAHQWNHREIFLDTNPIKRNETKTIRKSLQQKTEKQVEDITRFDIDSFRLELSKDNLSVKTINAHIITFRSWFKYLKKIGISCLDPTVLDLLTPPDREVVFLTTEEVEKFFFAIDRSTLIGKRDYAICQCIYSTGLRISELTHLERRDINHETQEFAVRGKGSKIRVVYLTDEASKAIDEYLKAREDEFSPLFIRHNFSEESIDSIHLTDETTRLSRFFITNMIKNYGIRAGILKNLHAHTLRHSFATTLLTNGADIRIIQELLGHASITTTQIYTHVTNPKLKEAHRKFHK